MQGSTSFDRVMNGKGLKDKPPQRYIEDFIVAMQEIFYSA
jgi:H+-transporting ATPase